MSVVNGQQPARMVPIAFVDCGALWCVCDYAMPESTIPEHCPGCGRNTSELLAEAARNAKVADYVESLPLDVGLPGLGESGLSWFHRMAAAWEATQ